MPYRLDDFNRANQTGLGTPSDGGTAWVHHSGSALSIVSNRASVATSVLQIATLEAGTNVGRASVTIAVTPGSGVLGLVLRRTSASLMVLCRLDLATGAIDVCGYQGFVVLSTAIGTAPSFTAGDTFAVEVDEDNFYTAYINGVQVGSPTKITSQPAYSVNGTGYGLWTQGSMSLDDFEFVPANPLRVEVDDAAINSGNFDPIGVIEENDSSPPERTYTLYNDSDESLTIGTITATGLTLVDDPGEASIPAFGSVPLTVKVADTSTLGQVASTITIPFGTGDDEFEINYRAAVVPTAYLTPPLVVMGNSLSHDSLGPYLDDGNSFSDAPYGAGLSPVLYQLRGGTALYTFVNDPWNDTDLLKPAAWPVTLKRSTIGALMIQPFAEPSVVACLTAAGQVIAEQPDVPIIIVHRSWPGQSGWDTAYAEVKALTDGVIAGLRLAYPDKDIRDTKMGIMLHFMRHDPNAPEDLSTTDLTGAVGLFRDDIHMSNGLNDDGDGLGRWLDNNAVRRAKGQPIRPVSEIITAGADETRAMYVLSVLNRFTGGDGSPRVRFRSSYQTGGTIEW